MYICICRRKPDIYIKLTFWICWLSVVVWGPQGKRSVTKNNYWLPQNFVSIGALVPCTFYLNILPVLDFWLTNPLKGFLGDFVEFEHNEEENDFKKMMELLPKQLSLRVNILWNFCEIIFILTDSLTLDKNTFSQSFSKWTHCSISLLG